jgi:hypothetical protein
VKNNLSSIIIIIIISLLMSPLLGHRPSLWITHKTGHNPSRGPSAGWCVLTTANAAGTNGLTCLPKHGGTRDNIFLVTDSVTYQRCLTFAIARRSALTAGPSSSTNIIITYIHTPLTLYPRRGSRGISNIPSRHPRFTKISWLWGTLQTWQVVSPSPSYCSLSQVEELLIL